MDHIDDDKLLSALQTRMEKSRIALTNLRAMTQSLEAVNEKLRQSEALKSDFLSNIRNEINNPLAAILGLASQIIDKQMDADTARSMAATIFREAFDLDFQLRNIFTAAELEAGEAIMTPARVDVAGLVRGQIKAFQHRAADKHLTVDLDCGACAPDGTLVFTTDPVKLRNVVANLLANAIEFNLDGKRVSIGLSQGGGGLRITIADEGIGIGEADLKRVFDRFVQLESGVRKSHHGHGLGLSITKALVQMLGGTVGVASKAGAGCVFTVVLSELEPGRPIDVSSGDGNELIFDEGVQF
jgi:signal transduction histidine kinase